MRVRRKPLPQLANNLKRVTEEISRPLLFSEEGNRFMCVTGSTAMKLEAEESRQTSLESEVVPCPMKGKQTWPIEEVMALTED